VKTRPKPRPTTWQTLIYMHKRLKLELLQTFADSTNDEQTEKTWRHDCRRLS
jgi:hypothetical protein